MHISFYLVDCIENREDAINFMSVDSNCDTHNYRVDDIIYLESQSTLKAQEVFPHAYNNSTSVRFAKYKVVYLNHSIRQCCDIDNTITNFESEVYVVKM